MLLKFRRWLLQSFTPISKFLSSLHMPYSHKLISGLDYYDLAPKLRPGDFFVSRIDGELTNLLIPDFWTHGAIYCGVIDGREYVVEATTKGVIKTDLITFLLKKDYIAVMRPRFLTSTQCLAAVAFALSKIGTMYDWLFEFNEHCNKYFYCFELGAVSYNEAHRYDGGYLVRSYYTDGSCQFEAREFMGIKTFTGKDFVNAKKRFKLIWTNHKKTMVEHSNG